MATRIKHSNATILYRSEQNRVLGGVCGGLGEVFKLDPTILRVLFLLIILFGGSGLFLYLILWVVIPTESKIHKSSDQNIRENIEEMKERAQDFAKDFRGEKDHSRMIVGVAILVAGLLFLLGNFGYGYLFNFHKLWPLLLIILGFFVLTRKDGRAK